MKKFIAMVMTAAMVASLVPATAFAASDALATAQVVNVWTRKDSFPGTVNGTPIATANIPELQVRMTSDSNQKTGDDYETELVVTLDNADFLNLGGKIAQEGKIFSPSGGESEIFV